MSVGCIIQPLAPGQPRFRNELVAHTFLVTMKLVPMAALEEIARASPIYLSSIMMRENWVYEDGGVSSSSV